MTDLLLSTDAYLIWHDWSRTLAFVVLGLGLGYALLQFALRGSGTRVARFVTGGSLRIGLVVGLTLVSIVPAAAMVLLLAERSAHLRHDRMATRLEESAVTLAGDVDQFMDKHLAAVTSAARAASNDVTRDRASLNGWLLLYHEIYDDFLTMLAADASGRIVAATSNMTGFLGPVDELVAHNVSDRSYFQRPLADGRPFISEVFKGRDLGSDPIVAVSAPIKDVQGTTVGVLEGSLDLSAFRRLDEARPHVDGSVMILVDPQDRVIYASAGTGFAALQNISSDPLIATARLTQSARRYDYVAGARSQERRYLGTFATTDNGWRVYLRAPLDQIAQQMGGDYRVGAALLLVALTLSLLLAGALIRRVSGTVADMNRAVARFRLDGKGERVTTPAGTPSEFRPIFSQMRRRSIHLQKAHARLNASVEAGEGLRRELTQAIALRDLEIEERTAELEAANERLSGLSKSDPLTGIANRREFDDFAARVWRQAARDMGPAAIILIDVDFFKIYNDTLGHQAGDDCLRRIAGALAGCAQRALDLVARYGGEEFVAVLAATSLDDALIVGERMRNVVAGLRLPHPGSPFGTVTVSVGVAAADAASADDRETTIRGADESLYYAKAAGRNCVVYQDDGEYVTFDPEAEDPAKTNVLSIMTSRQVGSS